MRVSGSVPPPLSHHTVEFVGTNLYLFGGTDGKTSNNDVYVLDTGMIVLYIYYLNEASQMNRVDWFYYYYYYYIHISFSNMGVDKGNTRRVHSSSQKWTQFLCC